MNPHLKTANRDLFQHGFNTPRLFWVRVRAWGNETEELLTPAFKGNKGTSLNQIFLLILLLLEQLTFLANEL